MKIHDISQTIRTGIPVWPGDSEFSIDKTWSLDMTCPVNVSKLTLSTHTGTHADAPVHYGNGGDDISEVSLVPYLGEVHVVDAIDCGALIEPHHIEDELPDRVVRVLVRTFGKYPGDKWPDGFSAFHKDTIHMLAAKGCILVGIDTPSVDPESSKDLPSHNAIKKYGMAILEGLVLSDIVAGTYELIALPLKIAEGDASPVRAVLRDIK